VASRNLVGFPAVARAVIAASGRRAALVTRDWLDAELVGRLLLR
jgi:hypothetical protein